MVTRFKHWLTVAGLLMGWPAFADAATLYISEFPSGVSQSGSAVAQLPGQSAITDQTVALSGSSARSAAFNTRTNAVSLMCDQGCSIAFGSSSVTAATTNYLLQQGVPYRFVVSPGTYVAAISNAAGNTSSGGGSGAASSQVQGNTASGTTDVGNPVKTGGVFNTTLPTVTSGQRVDTQSGVDGGTYISPFSASLSPVDGQINSGLVGTWGVRTLSTGASATQTAPLLFNGANWDRARSGGVTGMAGVVPQASPSGGGTYAHIAAGQATTTVKSGAGTLYAIVLNGAATATNVTTVYDSTTGSGTVVAVPSATAVTAPVTLTFGTSGLAFTTGLTIVTATANGADMTVIYK